MLGLAQLWGGTIHFGAWVEQFLRLEHTTAPVTLV